MRRSGGFGSQFGWLNVFLTIGALALWIQICRVAIYPHDRRQVTKTSTAAPPHVKTGGASVEDKGSDLLNSLTNGDQALHDCLEKANPLDPLGVSSDNPGQAEQRKVCMEKYGGGK